VSGWLAPLTGALDSLDGEVEMFFRDDDAGWADVRLFALLNAFAACACPIDLAVIPGALTRTLATALLDLKRGGCAIGFHQHGFSHENHEPLGRPCEFGPSRTAALQSRDIKEGQRRLAAHLGEHLDPIFTPPWNRCTPETGRALVESGIRAISLDATAKPLNIDGLAECPVRVDWLAKANGRRLSRDEWASMLARHVTGAAGPVGVMLHHAEMDAGEIDGCEQVVRILAAHPKVRVVSMREAAVKN